VQRAALSARDVIYYTQRFVCETKVQEFAHSIDLDSFLVAGFHKRYKTAANAVVSCGSDMNKLKLRNSLSAAHF
jgi:hypothetical protein